MFVEIANATAAAADPCYLSFDELAMTHSGETIMELVTVGFGVSAGATANEDEDPTNFGIVSTRSKYLETTSFANRQEVFTNALSAPSVEFRVWF